VAEPNTALSGPSTSLVDLLDRVVHRGVVINGDVIISLAGIDLIRLDLRLLLLGIGGLATTSAPGATEKRAELAQ
jgi:hypothetical protein